MANKLLVSLRWQNFNRYEKAFLRDIIKAKALVDKHFSGLDSNSLCDAMADAQDALLSIINGLEPAKKSFRCKRAQRV